jgi:RNA polymerase sigma factor (sigma-70 family)
MSPIRDGEKFCKCFLADTMEEASELMAAFDRDITMLAAKFASFARNLDKEDLEQEGLIGLARANRDFDEGRSENFRIFAIYKIKDAMREFVTTQSSNVRVPQYVKEALRLSWSLGRAMEKGGYMGHDSIVDLWDISANFEADPAIIADVDKIRRSLKSLADRCHTTVYQLLERAEVTPISITTSLDIYDPHRLDNFPSVEDSITSYLATEQSMKNLRDFLTEDEFKLLHARYVEGKTLRELAPEMGITAPSVHTRAQNILKKLKRNEKRILCYESDTDTEKTEPGYGS